MSDSLKIISIEGIDGAGKSTQAAALSLLLNKNGVVSFDKRPSTFAASTINDLAEALMGDRYAYDAAVPPNLREFVLACDINHSIKLEILPRMAAGEVWVWDRGPLCYASYARAYDGYSEWVKTAQTLFPEPTLYVLLDIPVESAIQRLDARTEKPRQTDESKGLLEKVSRELAIEASTKPNLLVLDGLAPREAITTEIFRFWTAQVG